MLKYSQMIPMCCIMMLLWCNKHEFNANAIQKITMQEFLTQIEFKHDASPKASTSAMPEARDVTTHPH